MEEVLKKAELEKTKILIPKLNMKSVKMSFDKMGYTMFNRSSNKTTCNITAKTLRSSNSKTILHSRDHSNEFAGQRSKFS